jgi:hypothetical protein
MAPGRRRRERSAGRIWTGRALPRRRGALGRRQRPRLNYREAGDPASCAGMEGRPLGQALRPGAGRPGGPSDRLRRVAARLQNGAFLGARARRWTRPARGGDAAVARRRGAAGSLALAGHLAAGGSRNRSTMMPWRPTASSSPPSSAASRTPTSPCQGGLCILDALNEHGVRYRDPPVRHLGWISAARWYRATTCSRSRVAIRILQRAMCMDAPLGGGVVGPF